MLLFGRLRQTSEPHIIVDASEVFPLEEIERFLKKERTEEDLITFGYTDKNEPQQVSSLDGNDRTSNKHNSNSTLYAEELERVMTEVRSVLGKWGMPDCLPLGYVPTFLEGHLVRSEREKQAAIKELRALNK